MGVNQGQTSEGGRRAGRGRTEVARMQIGYSVNLLGGFAAPLRPSAEMLIYEKKSIYRGSCLYYSRNVLKEMMRCFKTEPSFTVKIPVER